MKSYIGQLADVELCSIFHTKWFKHFCRQAQLVLTWSWCQTDGSNIVITYRAWRQKGLKQLACNVEHTLVSVNGPGDDFRTIKLVLGPLWWTFGNSKTPWF